MWLPVHNEKYSQSYCLDELELSSGQDNSHEIHHTNQALVYCGIERFSDYVSKVEVKLKRQLDTYIKIQFV